MTTLEDRLRAHYADRTARETLPGPSTDEALEALLRGEGRLVAVPAPTERRPGVRWSRHRGLLAAAAALVVALVVIGALVATREQRARVSTEPHPPVPPTTSTTAPPPTTIAPAPGGAASAPPPAGLVVAAEGVLGRWDGSTWVVWPAGQEPPGGDEYAIVRLDDPITTHVGESAPGTCGSGGGPTVDVGLSPDGGRYTPAPIAVAGVDDPRPRPVDVLAATEDDQQAAEDIAGSRLGIAGEPPTVTQVVRGDLDGDGTDEVLVTAERAAPDGGSGLVNDVAIVFLRRVVGSTVENELVDATYPGQEEAPGSEAYRVAALADLNGDGRMEVVVDDFSYGGAGVMVYAVGADGALTQVLSTFCGD